MSAPPPENVCGLFFRVRPIADPGAALDADLPVQGEVISAAGLPVSSPIASRRLVKEPASPTAKAWRRHWPMCRRESGEGERSSLCRIGGWTYIALKQPVLCPIVPRSRVRFRASADIARERPGRGALDKPAANVFGGGKVIDR